MPTPSPKPEPKGPYKYKTSVVKEGPFKGATMMVAMTTAELNAEKAKAPGGTSVWRDPSIGYDGNLNPMNIPGLPDYKKPVTKPKGSILASSEITKKPTRGNKA